MNLSKKTNKRDKRDKMKLFTISYTRCIDGKYLLRLAGTNTLYLYGIESICLMWNSDKDVYFYEPKLGSNIYEFMLSRC